jgi:hypothetical protein
MGTSESGECSFNCAEAGQAHHVGCWQEEDRSGTKGTVGKGESGEEGCLSKRSLLRRPQIRVGLWVWVLGNQGERNLSQQSGLEARTIYRESESGA